MQALWEVASPLTWALLSGAAFLLLLGFVLLSHILVRKDGHGEEFSGATHRGRLESSLRLGVAALCAGFCLWSVALGAPLWVPLGIGVLAGAAAALEGVALVRG